MSPINPIQLQKFLKGIDYPASKRDLIAKAEQLGADEPVRKALDALPDQRYQTPAEVNQAVAKVG